MNAYSLSHSLTSVGGQAFACPQCHGTSTVANGLCLACMLKAGIEQEEADNQDELAATLDAIAVSDTHWRLGNYEILEEIGRGGMGVIYRARQRHSRRIVAVKRLLSYHADSRETLARFRREAEAAASLDHPNILPIYEVSETEEGTPFFSMKFAAGGSLQQVGLTLRDNPREVIRIMAKVTRAIQHAHRQGILHRDLKPGNILLDARGEPLVTDFGLAKWLETNTDLTRTLTVFGTPGYIAPEQARGKAADLKPNADVYSLGAILFELLAGRPPFLGEHALAVIQQAAEKPAPKLRSLVKGADRDLETICSRCLERDPASRYQSAGDLAEDLERWLEGRPIIARPVSAPVKVWRWSKRKPYAASTVAIILCLGGITALTQVQRTYLTREMNRAAEYRRSVAILPFLDLDTASANQTLCTSLSTFLMTGMEKRGPARVVPVQDPNAISPAMATADDIRIASLRAKTRSVLIGTIRNVPGARSVSISLLDAKSQRKLFGCRFESKTSDSDPWFWSPLSIAKVFDSLETDRQIDEASIDPAIRNTATAEFLRAGHRFEERRTTLDFDRALGLFQKAIDAEPFSALGRANFAMAAIARYYCAKTSPELLAKATALTHEAINLNPALPEAHRALAAILYANGDFAGTHEQSLQAIELGGLNQGVVQSLATTTRTLGRPDISLRWQRISHAIQENPADYEFEMAGTLTALGEDKKAEEIYQRVLALHPEFPEGWIGMCELRLLQRDFGGARQICQEHLSKFSDYPFAKRMAAQVEFFARNWSEAERRCLELLNDDQGSTFGFGMIPLQSALGFLRRIGGDEIGANQILTQYLESTVDSWRRTPDNPETLYRLAAGEALLAKNEDALQHLQEAFQRGFLDYRFMELDPRWDRLQMDKRFWKLSEAMATRVAELRTAASQPNKMTATEVYK